MKNASIILNRGFTLMELLIAIVILLFFGTLATTSYQKLLDNARETVCRNNVNALVSAVGTYALEHDALPAVLGDLDLEHLEKAYAQVMQESDWHTTFSHLFLEMNLSDEAYAQFLTNENLIRYGASKKMFRCPADENGGVSYGINGNLFGKTWDEIGDDDLLIGDCDTYVFSGEDELRKRHRKGTMAVVLTKNRKIKKPKKDKDKDKDK